MSESKPNMRHIVCKDGACISVQASKSHYCEPRSDAGPYSLVEVGFPTIAPPAKWEQYAEDRSQPTSTVYAYMPVEMVEEFIAEHGGIDLAATL